MGKAFGTFRPNRKNVGQQSLLEIHCSGEADDFVASHIDVSRDVFSCVGK